MRGGTKKMIGQVGPGNKQDLEERTTRKNTVCCKLGVGGMWAREACRGKFVPP